MNIEYPKPPFSSQKQPMPGSTEAMKPRPDHGETSYKGSGRLKGLTAVITGGEIGLTQDRRRSGNQCFYIIQHVSNGHIGTFHA